jgi:hypothetical protein
MTKPHRNQADPYDRQTLSVAILDRISKGEPLEAICRTDGFPSVSAFHSWKDDDPELAGHFARARERGYDAIAAETLRISDGAQPEDVQVARLRVDTRLKLLAKWDPKRYGDRTAVDVSGSIALNTVLDSLGDDE